MNPLNCREACEQLPFYADDELPPPAAMVLETHLADCATCKAQLSGLRNLSATIRSGAPYHRAPAALRARLGASSASAQAPPDRVLPTSASVNARVVKSSPMHRTRAAGLRWALPLAASVILAFGLTGLLELRDGRQAMADEVVSAHVRSLLANHLADVASGDHHTVKPWFAGKLDFAPGVRNLAAQGFPLVGGRLDYIAHRNVAALVYGHREHRINLFVWPAGSAPDSVPSANMREGYNLVHWVAGGMNQWAISDLNAVELREFADDLRKLPAEP